MVAAVLTSTVSSDGDDGVEPIEDSYFAVKSVATPYFDEACVVNSDDDSLSSSESISWDAIPTARPDTIVTGKPQEPSSDDDTDVEDIGHGSSASAFSTIRNPIFEASPRKINSSVKGTDLRQEVIVSVQKEDAVGGDDCDDDVNFADDVDERSRLLIAAQAAGIASDDSFSDGNEDGAVNYDKSRLMAAAQAAGIPSDDSFSDGSEDGAVNDDKSRLTAAAQAASIPSDDSFSDDSEDSAIKDGRSRLMAASIPSEDSFSDDGERTILTAVVQAAIIPSEDSFSDDSERTRLMAAAQAAIIPSDDSFEDDFEDGYVHPSSIGEEVLTRMVRTGARFLQDSEDLESDDSASRFSTVASSDDESQINRKILSDTTGISMTDYSPKLSSRYSAGEGGPDDNSNGRDQSDHSSRDDVEKTKRKAGKKVTSSRSFSGISTRFNWADVKTKIFYSFRALKASAGSSKDGSRTILVKNLAREVTDDRLHDVFQDSGGIVNIQIIRDAQSGLSSAYVEFESGNAARKALRKSGQKLEGRVILCDIAYENSKGNRSVLDSGHAARERSDVFESGSASTASPVLDALKIYDREIRDADAKFLSRFIAPFSSYNDTQSSFGYPKSITSPSRPKRGQYLNGSEGLVVPWPDLDDDPLLLGETEGELEMSFSGPHFDAVNMSGHLSRQSSAATHRKIPGLRKLHSRKFMRLFWPWRSLRWQGWQIAKESSTWAPRKSHTARRPKAIDTKHRTSQESVTRLKTTHAKLKTTQESVKLFC